MASRALNTGGALEKYDAVRYAQRMTTSARPCNIYQLRVVLRGISPLIWRRVLVRSETTRAHLHATLQILFAWSDEHLHSFHIHGQEHGSSGLQTRHVLLSDLQLHRGERFRSVYDFIAHLTSSGGAGYRGIIKKGGVTTIWGDSCFRDTQGDSPLLH
jgi:Plasmid pRiA4b ORF-3-like protein